jgi:hypothetical protein
MSESSDDLNSHLQRAFKKRDEANMVEGGASENLPVVKAEVDVVAEPQADAGDEVAHEKMGVIRRLQARNAASAHELQKARTTYETEIQLIRHKADAAIRESKAFWDAKSVEVAESIKTYVQATVRALEIDRLDSRNADLQRAYESASDALEKAKSSTMPEVMKDRLIQDILNNFEKTLARIQEDTIVSKDDLD